MSILYRFFSRCAALMVLMMACMMPAVAQQLPFTVTTNEEDPVLYWIESKGATGFYAIPHTDNTLVSTTNMPNLKALWYFMDASDGYYYIVNYKTGKYLKHEGTFNEENTIKLASLSGDAEPFKFSVVASEKVWVIYPKSAGTSYWVNKKSSNVHYEKYLKSSNYNNSPDNDSKWSFVPKDDVAWAHPFDNSTNEEKHYFTIQNATANGSAFYMSTDDASDPYATVSDVDNSKRVWYFMEADSNDTIPNLKYYYIVNANTGKYLKFTGTANGSSQASSLQLYEHHGTETLEIEDRFQFMVLNAKGKNYSAYSIMPKLEINYYYHRNTSLSPSSSYNNSLSNDMKIGIYNDRGQDNNYAHWTIEQTDFVLVEAPTITNNFNGTISLSTNTPNATIYYTTDGTTPDNTSTEYDSDFFSLGNATVIKAIAYLDSDYSSVSIYNVPKYTKPTISFDDNTSKITITCTDATGIYYTIDDSTPTTSSDSYSGPFTISSDITVKAIATHAGYLNSDVATWPIPQIHDYSQDYLTFDVITSGTILWKQVGSESRTISYSTDNGTTWTEITATTAGTAINVTAGDKVLLKGTNQSYAVDKSNYSGFDGGTATYDISGNIMSLIYGDNFVDKTALSDSYNFCSIFKQSKAVSAENLVLPATTLTEYCYRAMFSKAPNLAVAPALPATTLAKGCYWYMFEECPIKTAPDLDASTLVTECYGHMFENCSNLNYIKCLAVNKSATNCLTDWVKNVSSTGTFIKKEGVTWSTTGNNGTPTGWYVVDEGTPAIPTISCDGFEIELSCDTIGAAIYYRLDQSGNYTQYLTAITITHDTYIECYSEKNEKQSPIISNTCVYDSRTIYDYSNQSLDTWTYKGNTITTPFSVNAIDGHSSNYAKGSFSFETEVNLRSQQPTYLWFQHADQSASISVNDTLVEKHWGGYNAFFVDITERVHKGTNHINVVLKNNEGGVLAPYNGDFNFNATLGKVKLFTSPCLPAMSYGYDGFHITSTVSSASATINVKTTVPTGASVVCTITDGETQVFTDTLSSTGNEMVFTTTIENPHLWNGILDPHLYHVKLEIYHDEVLYHSYERPYGLRFYEYVINDTEKYGTEGDPYTGFLFNGQPYLLRGVCVHDDLAGKANALNDADYTQEFNIITELGCNFLRLAHYPHPKEVYDKCDELGIIVQTEAPWVNKSTMTETDDYWDHLEGQCTDMVNQHYNHPCIIFWGVGNEINTSHTGSQEGKNFVKGKIEHYRDTIRSLMPNAWVGYTVSHNALNGLGVFNNPKVDWIGQNIYVGWYIDQSTNDPTSKLETSINNAITRNTPCAYSEYGCGGTPTCHSDDFMSTTTRGNNPRHDIEYQMWLHEGHIAAIKAKPELVFTSQWQLFDIAVTSRQEGYKVSLDGETEFDNNELKRLNNKGLVERDHKTKKDTYYLYKAWWNQTDKFVHICGKNYFKTADRVIKCYTNDGNTLTLYVNGNPVPVETVTVTDNIATFTARNFSDGAVITVSGATTEDTFTIHNYDDENVFITEGDWNKASNWSGNAVPDDGSNVVIAADATIPANYVAHAGAIKIIPDETLTVKDGGQLYHNNTGVTATVQKDIAAYTVQQTQGETKTNGWYFIASPIKANLAPGEVTNMITDQIAPPYSYDLYRFNQAADDEWENYLQHSDDFNLVNGAGYLYANNSQVTLQFTGELKPYSTSANTVTLAQTGWNLIGNPFTCNVYADHAFYKMNEARTGLTAELPVSTVIAPCEGIFVNDAEGATVTFSKDAPAQSQSNNANLQIALSQPVTDRREGNASGMIDNAIVSFNEGFLLPKFYFGHQNANIYIPQNGKDYAIAFAEAKVGEIPLNFKAHENGEYTLSFSRTLNSSLLTLHLIDNLTGANVNLLQTPEYSFEARTSDYASRFRLVFAGKEDPSDDHDDFAFISKGEIIVIGEGTLQVFDVLGRQLFVKQLSTLNSQLSIPTSPGVYVLRLMDGEKVRVQKIVVE